MVLKRIDVLSAAKIGGILYAVLGLFFGGVMSLFGLLGASLAGSEGGEAWMGLIFGVGAIITLPIFYGVLGVVFSALSALLYNVIAGLVGGLEIDLQ